MIILPVRTNQSVYFHRLRSIDTFMGYWTHRNQEQQFTPKPCKVGVHILLIGALLTLGESQVQHRTTVPERAVAISWQIVGAQKPIGT